MTIKEELNKLKTMDVFSLLLFILYKIRDIEEYMGSQKRFENSDIFGYGNYGTNSPEESAFISFRAQNTQLYLKIKLDCIYIMCYNGYGLLWGRRIL